MFKLGDKWHEPFKNILLVYSLYNPEISYVQGMNYLLSLIYMNIQDEFESFKIFANLINREKLLQDFIKMNMVEMESHFSLIMQILKSKLPWLQ